MIYGITDRLPIPRLIMFAVQLVLSVFVATVLIANICNVAVSGALIGAGLSTIAYLIVTGFKSPMFVSSSGAFVVPVLAALAAGGYSAVAIGGLVTCVIYVLFGLLFSQASVDKIYTIFPPALIGAITVVIGVNLMPFILSYIQIDNITNIWGISAALLTTFSIAIISHYAKGVLRILPFLAGILIGYIYTIILTISNIYPIVDFSVFNSLSLFRLPDLAFQHWHNVDFAALIPIIILYAAFTLSAMMECLSDHAALSGIIGTDLYKNPGLSRIFIGEGVANVIGACIGGLGICSYGEGVACVGFSKVASTMVTLGAALILILLGYLAPVQAFIASIPSCVFAGAAVILYGFIACSGIKMLSKTNLAIQKNLIIVSAVLSLGISGLKIGSDTVNLSSTGLALIAGIILNLLLKDNNQIT